MNRYSYRWSNHHSPGLQFTGPAIPWGGTGATAAGAADTGALAGGHGAVATRRLVGRGSMLAAEAALIGFMPEGGKVRARWFCWRPDQQASDNGSVRGLLPAGSRTMIAWTRQSFCAGC